VPGILSGSVSCDVTLQGMVTPGQECTGTVTIGGAPVACNSPDGWKLKDPSTIEFDGASCQKLQNNPGAVVNASFPCGAFTIPK
jgi:hypothetical protein